MYEHGLNTSRDTTREKSLRGFFTTLSERLISTNYSNRFTAYIQKDTVLTLLVFIRIVPITATEGY